jgi:hypothetical protein
MTGGEAAETPREVAERRELFIGDHWRLGGPVIVLALVLIVFCSFLTNQIFGPTSPQPGLLGNALRTVASAVQVGAEIFIAVFAALQADRTLRFREQATRRRACLAYLEDELATLLDDRRLATRSSYRDPVRLLMPGQLLGGELLRPEADADLIAALFSLQEAVGRYNDLVLTNALVLVEGMNRQLDAVAQQYWRAIEVAAAQVRPFLDDIG